MPPRARKGARQRPRACEACRECKTKCHTEADNVSCSKCIEQQIDCSFVERTTVLLNAADVTGRLVDISEQIEGVYDALNNQCGLIQQAIPFKLLSGKVGSDRPSIFEQFPTGSIIVRDGNEAEIANRDDLQNFQGIGTSSSAQERQLRLAEGDSKVVSELDEMPADSGVTALGHPYPLSMACLVSSAVSPSFRYGQHFIGPAVLPVPGENIVLTGVLSRKEVIELVSYFRGNYNHWVLFPKDISAEELTDLIMSRSHLLVLACCCVALRFGKSQLKTKVLPVLVKMLQTELHKAATHVPQTTDFLRAVALIANFGDSLSCHEPLFDIWAVTSLGLHHFSTVMGVGLQEDEDPVRLRLWNHIVLAHLSVCTLRNRQCLVDQKGIRLCRSASDYQVPSNFDMCMVAEITIYDISYRYSTCQTTFNEARAELQQWQDEWRFLLVPTTIQFVGALYRYLDFSMNYQEAVRASGLTHEDAMTASELARNDPTCQASAAYFEAVFKNHDTTTLVLYLVGLTETIQSLIHMVTEDFFAFLSDGLQTMGFVASVIVTRLVALLAQRVLNADSSLAVDRAIHLVRTISKRFQHTSENDGDMCSCFALGLFDLLHRLNM